MRCQSVIHLASKECVLDGCGDGAVVAGTRARGLGVGAVVAGIARDGGGACVGGGALGGCGVLWE